MFAQTQNDRNATLLNSDFCAIIFSCGGGGVGGSVDVDDNGVAV